MMAGYSNQGGGFLQGGVSPHPSSQTDTSPRTSMSKGGRGGAAPSLRPLTLKQLFLASQLHQEDSFRVDDKELFQVTFIGVIRTVQTTSTFVSYLIEDGTGSMEVKMWMETDVDDQSSKRDALREGMYVRVFGQLRSFNGKRSINAYNIRPITDFNEITHHLLETAHSHLVNTRGPQDGGNGKTPGMSSAQYGGHADASHGFGAGAGMSDVGDTGGFTPLQFKVLAILRKASSSVGVHIKTILTELGGKVPERELMNTIDFLSSEGHLYSSIDEYHYKATE